MKTPIYDFVRSYAESGSARFHMPGHKGRGTLGIEAYDITEISGADSLFEARGIIKESEGYASELFGSYTYYSTEGSSLAIRAALYLATRGTGSVIAPRNVHKSFVSAAALIGFDCIWLEGGDSYLTAEVTPKAVEAAILAAENVAAVYLTSPDYLGNMLDIGAIASVCHAHGVLLIVDNAHGAYLNFTVPNMHPMTLGADMCADSAHKTLPTLTGGAYLHISKNAPKELSLLAKDALSLFASTSPSYLILSSLDLTNKYISDGLGKRLAALSHIIRELRLTLAECGIEVLAGDSVEPLKLTIFPKSYGYLGREIAGMLAALGIECEFSDPDIVVFMISPENTGEELLRLGGALLELPRRAPITDAPPKRLECERRLSVRAAVMSRRERVKSEEALGRVLAQASFGCPPAVPIILPGEVIDESALLALRYYGIDELCVVCEKEIIK